MPLDFMDLKTTYELFEYTTDLALPWKHFKIFECTSIILETTESICFRVLDVR